MRIASLPPARRRSICCGICDAVATARYGGLFCGRRKRGFSPLDDPSVCAAWRGIGPLLWQAACMVMIDDIAKMLIFSYRRMIMAYSPNFRKKVLETLSCGLSVRTTAALFGIHFTTIQNWKKHPEKAKTPQKRPPKKIRTEELLVDIEMYPTDYLRTCS